jgi:toxin ParE1/3/4
MKVHWTDTAVANLDAVYAYISQNSELYARRTVDKITRSSEQIAMFPLSGREVPEYKVGQIREVYVHPYRIIYYIKPDQIDVLAVVHSARDISTDENKFS